MSTFTALLDANVLYPAPIRDILLQLAVMDVYRARWSAAIHDEWISALLRNQPHRSRDSLERTRALMDRSTRDCLVTGYADLIPSLTLPDPKDRHVLAAAIVGRCDAIVTQNLKDFPNIALTPFGIDAQHPDAFLCNQLSLSPGAFCAAVKKVHARLKAPPFTVDAYLGRSRARGSSPPSRSSSPLRSFFKHFFRTLAGHSAPAKPHGPRSGGHRAGGRACGSGCR